MTVNSYGDVVFDGVCTNLSNAAYPVEEVQEMVVGEVPKKHENLCVHIALSLIHEGIVERDEKLERYTLVNTSFSRGSGNNRVSRSELVDIICEQLNVTVDAGGEDEEMRAREDFVGFIQLLDKVLNALTDGEWFEEYVFNH